MPDPPQSADKILNPIAVISGTADLPSAGSTEGENAFPSRQKFLLPLQIRHRRID
jgi:hypothetical protein